MRTFIIGITLYLLDYFKIPNVEGELLIVIIIGIGFAMVQDLFEISDFIRKVWHEQ